MPGVGRHLFGFLYAILLLSTTVLGLVDFLDPKGPDGAVTLTVGQKFLVNWENAANDYSELSLGVMSKYDGYIYWIIKDALKYTSHNYLWTVALGTHIKLSQGNSFSFIIVNGTKMGERVTSPHFTIVSAPGSPKSSPKTSSKTPPKSSPKSSLKTSLKMTLTITLPQNPTTNPSVTTSSTTPLPTNLSIKPASTPPVILVMTQIPVSSTSSTNRSNTSFGLSAGARVGIGISAFVGVSLLVTAAAFLFHHKKKSKRENDDHGNLTNPLQQFETRTLDSNDSSASKEVQILTSVYQPYQTNNDEVYEISSASQGPHELPASE